MNGKTTAVRGYMKGNKVVGCLTLKTGFANSIHRYGIIKSIGESIGRYIWMGDSIDEAREVWAKEQAGFMAVAEYWR